MVIVLGFNQLQSTVQMLPEMAEHKNMGATANTITDYSTQPFIKEIVICDKRTDRYQLASIKLIKQRLKDKKVRDKWNDLQKQLMNMPGKKHFMVLYKTATMRY